MFELFDPAAEVQITSGNLPHWFQPGATYFVTFRTEDSIPQDVASRWRQERSDWLHRHGIDAGAADLEHQLGRLSPEVVREYHSRFSIAYLNYLDQGYGECPLREAELAGIVGDAFRHFDGQRYWVSDFVVMPNHAHVLVGLIGEHALANVCYSWKKFTALQINRRLGRSGRFWQEESFDHLVRSPEHFERFRRYIAENPVRAGLRSGEYLNYSRGNK